MAAKFTISRFAVPAARSFATDDSLGPPTGVPPWLGLFHKMTLADAFCVLDTVDYSKDFINRNLIKTARGPLWLSVPVDAHGAKRICDVRIADGIWRRKHLKSIEYAYSRAPFFADYAPDVMKLIAKPYGFCATSRTK